MTTNTARQMIARLSAEYGTDPRDATRHAKSGIHTWPAGSLLSRPMPKLRIEPDTAEIFALPPVV